jgi:hypothetical protein
MGCGNSSTITTDLERTNMFYFTDEIISGTVNLNVTKGKVEADEIYIQLTGEIGYTTTRTTTDSQGRYRTQTDYHHVPFYSAKAVFAQPKPGEKQVLLGEGKYSWPFQIPLTDHLPPTLNQANSYPHVRYALQVVIDKAWYKANKRETKYLTIFPRVNLLQNPQCLSSVIFGNHNRKDITLKGTLNKTGYIPGELINLTIEIENPQRITIKHIDCSLLQSYRIGQNSRGHNIFQATLPNIMSTKNEHIKEVHSIQIPSTMFPPSLQYCGGIQTAAFVDLRYMLRLAVKVEGMFTNFDVDIPIIFGTDPSSNPNHQETFNPTHFSYLSNPEQSLSVDHDAPPSYDSVMQIKK